MNEVDNDILYLFKKYYMGNNYDENMFDSDGNINPNYNSFKKTGIIATIFEDYWSSIYNANKNIIDKYKPNANKEVQKIIDCHNKSLGCSIYECPECHNFIFVGHTCKSRLCSSCGYKYKLQRVENIMQTAYNCKHRQIVFTIPKELRKLFFINFSLAINILFDAVSKTIYSILNFSFKKSSSSKKKKIHKSKINWSPGFFSFLHTFGRDMKWNPHIHVLIAEIKIGSDNSVKDLNYFNYDALSKRFQKNLLDALLKHNLISKNTVRSQYLNHKNGYYVYAEPKKFKSLKQGIEYVTRYCGRAVISENRILNYDGQNVTFFYNAHEDDSYHEVTVSASEFILMIIRHLIPEQFKIIRYFGFYRKKPAIHDKMVLLIDKCKRKIRKELLRFDNLIYLSFHRQALNCPKCDTKMNFLFEFT